MSNRSDPTQIYANASVGTGANGGNAWHAYFGDPPFPQMTSAYDRQNRVTLNLPEAYKGRNLKLEDTLDQMVLFDETWYTRVALPIRKTDQISVAWDEIKFNQNFTNLVPEQGVSRLVTSTREERQDNFLRRGLAMMLEHGFMETPKGRQEYFWNLKQIAMAVQETNNFGVIYAYLTAHNFDKKWEFNHGYMKGETINTLMDREKFMWAITQKQTHGLEKLDAEVVEWMNAKRGKADMWIFPPALMVYIKVVPPEHTQFWLTGEKRILGPENAAKQIPTSFDTSKNKIVQDKTTPFSVFNGNAVYITRSFDVDARGKIDIMKRQRQIGEYNFMYDRYASGDFKDYLSRERAIALYDEDNDRWTTVDLSFAIENSLLFDERGELQIPHKRFDVEMFDEDIQDDFLTMADPHDRTGTRRVNVRFFGNIAEKHMMPRSVINLATTLINGVAENYKSRSTMLAIWNAGIGVLRRIEKAKFNADWFTALNVTEAEKSNAQRLSKRAFRSRVMQEAEFDESTGTIELPEIQEGDSPLPIGYANWPGMVALANEYDFNTTMKEGSLKNNKNYPLDIIKKASRFVELFRRMVDRAKTVLPRSIFLNAKLTSPWFPLADQATVMFENLVGHVRHPIWVRGGGGSGGGSGGGRPPLQRSQSLRQPIGAEINNPQMETTLDAYLRKVGEEDVSPDSAAAIRDFFDAALPNPDDSDPGAQAKLATRTAMITLLTTINTDQVQNKAEADRQLKNNVNKFVNTFTREGQREKFDIETFFNWAVANVGVFNVESVNRLKRMITRQKSHIESARALDSQIRKTGKNPTTEIEAFSGEYVRTPLTMSPELFASWKAAIDKKDGSALVILPSNPANPDFTADKSQVTIMSASIDRGTLPAHLKTLEEMIENDISSCVLMTNCSALGGSPAMTRSAPVSKDINSHISSSSTTLGGLQSFMAGDIESVLSSGGSYNPASNGIGAEMMPLQDTRTFASSGAVDLSGVPISYIQGNFKRNFNSVAMEANNGMERVFGQAYLGTPVTKRCLQQLNAKNAVVPMNFIIARPHMRYWMALGIKTLAGSETGNTFMGPSDFQLADDAKVKIHYGNYTYYSKAIVKRQENVFIANDIHSMGTLGGAGVKPMSTNRDVYNPRRDKYGNGSIFVMAVPYEQRSLPNPLDAAGRFYQFNDEGLLDKENFFQLHYNTAARYNRFWGFKSRNDLGEIHEPLSAMKRSVVNSVMWEGATWYYNRVTGRNTIPTPNTGHWGHVVGTGAKEARQGKLVHFPKKDYNDCPL